VKRQLSAPIGGPTTLLEDGPAKTSPRGGREGTTDSKAKKPGAAANLREAPALKGMPDKSKPKPN
jgi:hypothetical protein